MTNQELYKEIKELRRDFQEFKDNHHKEFYLFKGKAFGFITFLSVVFGFIADFINKKL